jgi:hypothetical protein
MGTTWKKIWISNHAQKIKYMYYFVVSWQKMHDYMPEFWWFFKTLLISDLFNEKYENLTESEINLLYARLAISLCGFWSQPKLYFRFQNVQNNGSIWS